MPSPSQRHGHERETRAIRYLEDQGYRVEGRNWRGGGGEIDVVAWDGPLICFVEVRARSRDDYGLPMETVDRRKQRKLIRAAMVYLMRFPPSRMPMARFDVVSIVDGDIVLVKNAFDGGR